jgi:hypothetical protein
MVDDPRYGPGAHAEHPNEGGEKLGKQGAGSPRLPRRIRNSSHLPRHSAMLVSLARVVRTAPDGRSLIPARPFTSGGRRAIAREAPMGFEPGDPEDDPEDGQEPVAHSRVLPVGAPPVRPFPLASAAAGAICAITAAVSTIELAAERA